VPVADRHLLGITVEGPSLAVLRCADRGQPINTQTPLPWLADLPPSARDGNAPSFEMPGTNQVSDAPPAGEDGATPALGAVTLVGGGRAVPVGGGGTVAGESNSPPEKPGRKPTTGAHSPLGAGQTASLAECQRGGVGAHPSPLYGQRSDKAPPFLPPRVEAVGSSSGTVAEGTPAGLGSSRLVDAWSLNERERQRRELQKAFRVTPEDLARAQGQRSTRDHWSLDPPSAAGGAQPSLHWVGGVAAQGLLRSVADTRCPRHLDQVFRDAAGEAFTVASDGTPVPGHSAAIASALAAAQGPSPMSTSAGETVAPGPGSYTPGNAPPGEGRAVTASALTVGASRPARPTRMRSRQAAERPRQTKSS